MHVSSTLMLVLSSVGSAQLAYWGPKFHIGPTKTEIISMSCNFRPGYPPDKEEDFVALWPGLWNPRSLQYDLIQAVTSVHSRSYMQTFCGARLGQWCTQAYVLRSGRPDTPQKGHAIDGNDMLTIEYHRAHEGDGRWTQSISSQKKGRLVTFTTGNRPATIMETGTEMQGSMAKAKQGTGDFQIYSNLTIILKAAEPEFGRTFSTSAVGGVNVRADRPYTPDGGKTWIIRKAIVPPMNPGTSVRPGGREHDREDKTEDRHDSKGDRREDVRNARIKFRWFTGQIDLLQQ